MAMLRQIATGIAVQFGSDCEVVLHDLTRRDTESSIAFIKNGHVTGRQVGDGPSQVVLEQLGRDSAPPDHLGYLTATPDGKVLKSSTMYIKDAEGHVDAILSINFDVTKLNLLSGTLTELIAPRENEPARPATIPKNVNDLLDDLIRRSVELVGKPVALMTKDDKIKAIQFLSGAGAFLITRSGDKISKYFGISKYTLYSYIDAKTGG
ncbi:MAG: transcriptional regulator [Oscillospiraceae bacterium]